VCVRARAHARAHTHTHTHTHVVRYMQRLHFKILSKENFIRKQRFVTELHFSWITLYCTIKVSKDLIHIYIHKYIYTRARARTYTHTHTQTNKQTNKQQQQIGRLLTDMYLNEQNLDYMYTLMSRSNTHAAFHDS